jgi:hypothetical protein
MFTTTDGRERAFEPAPARGLREGRSAAGVDPEEDVPEPRIPSDQRAATQALTALTPR